MLSRQLQLTLDLETAYRGRWLKVFIPYPIDGSATLSLCNADGALVKKVSLSQGHNAIDISAFNEGSLHVKLETPFETLFTEINLH